MIKVIVGTNLSKKQVIINPEVSLRSVLDEAEVDYSNGLVTLDGATLKAGDFDKSFADFGVAEKCYLLKVAKQDNA